jgi:hypothetical protein
MMLRTSFKTSIAAPALTPSLRTCRVERSTILNDRGRRGSAGAGGFARRGGGT